MSADCGTPGSQLHATEPACGFATDFWPSSTLLITAWIAPAEAWSWPISPGASLFPCSLLINFKALSPARHHSFNPQVLVSSRKHSFSYTRDVVAFFPNRVANESFFE